MAASWTNHLGYLEWHPSLSSPRLFNPSSFALLFQCIFILFLQSLLSLSTPFTWRCMLTLIKPLPFLVTSLQNLLYFTLIQLKIMFTLTSSASPSLPLFVFVCFEKKKKNSTKRQKTTQAYHCRKHVPLVASTGPPHIIKPRAPFHMAFQPG